MSESEAFARTRIESHLKNLGWDLEGKNRNVLQEGECKTPAQKRKLKNSKPDYILYKSGTNAPIGIIEVKRPGKNLNAALAQGQKYAKKLGVNVVFASDSYVTLASDNNGRSIQFGGIKIDNFVREPMLTKIAGDPDDDVNEVVVSREELIKIFKKAEKELRNDGIDAGMDAVYQFCIILFIKINSETKGDNQWENLSNQSVSNVKKEFYRIIQEYKEDYRGIFRKIEIKSRNVLFNIIAMLKDVNLVDTNIDIKGEAYEHFIKRYASFNKSVLGQYFTPRHITDMMAIYLDPSVGEKIYDPFCGTGGMLISCYRSLINYLETDDDEYELRNNTLYGRDINNGASQLAQMNMIVIGDGHTNIKRGDSLKSTTTRFFDKVITNIPFNLKLDRNHMSYSHYKNVKNSNFMCIHHCLKSVKVGGEALIIVPENICYLDSCIEDRKLLLKEARLNAVIRLPRATFKSYTAARTCILHFTDIGKKKKTKEFSYIEIHHDGYSDSTWREPIDKNDIPKFLENRDELGDSYELLELDETVKFVKNEVGFETSTDFWTLSELVFEKEKFSTSDLDPDEEYNEPRLDSNTNTISARGEARLGRNFKGDKCWIEPGDLVIGTLHTQRGNGLFAISDDYYLGTSQLVLQIDTRKVDKDYLVECLRRILPTLVSDDLVGRETYKISDLLNLKIPKQPKWFKSDTYKREKSEFEKLKNKLEKRKKLELDKVFNK